jgi:TRAP transporter TAXI family solute receptor
MKWLRVFVLTAATVSTVAGAQVASPPTPRTELMLLTGSESGIYFRMGRDIRRLLNEVVPEAGIELAVVPSQGALQNVIDVFRHSSIQLAITQSDVLAYLEIYARGDPDARRAVGGLQIVGRLYEEDVHLVARPGVNALGDLSGKRIDIGPPGSGTSVTALVLLHLAGVEPREVVNLPGISDSVTALRRGRIDAFFRVTATPAEDLRDSISASHGFVLVPIRLGPKPADSRLAEHYPPATIPVNAYPWLDRAVDTVKMRTVVVTAGVPAGTPACDAIGRLVKAALQNQAWLRQHGHPQWRNLRGASAAILEDPRLSPCAAPAYR